MRAGSICLECDDDDVGMPGVVGCDWIGVAAGARIGAGRPGGRASAGVGDSADAQQVDR